MSEATGKPRSVRGGITMSKPFQDWAAANGHGKTVETVKALISDYDAIKSYADKTPEELRKLLVARQAQTAALEAALAASEPKVK